MSAWLAAVIAKVIQALTIDFFMWVVGGISFLIEKVRRIYVQKEAVKKVDEDIQNKAPRTDETRKNEDDWMNS